VEQKLTIALQISQRVYVMGHGQIVFEGTPDDCAPTKRSARSGSKSEPALHHPASPGIMSQAHYTTHGAIAVVTLDNPPVNSLAYSHRLSIAAHVRTADADDRIKAIIIIGSGNAFCGGAEIREFNTPAQLAQPNTRDVIAIVEACSKPVIAAVHKVAMGGGLELALGCHYRVCAPGAQIALPEVKLGLLPGAGGTQRLPRAVGAEMALEMISTGNATLSERIAKRGLFSEVIEGDLLAGRARVRAAPGRRGRAVAATA
jgi:enoyl-CoA hydratase/carnithine racemase